MNLESRRLRIGILYPMHSSEDEYPRLAQLLVPPVEVEVVHTHGPDVHRIELSLVTGSRESIAVGVEVLKDRRVEVCMWACTSASFVFGVAGARRQVDDIAESMGVPTSSTSLAFLSALQVLGLKRVAIASTYPAELSGAFQSFLQEEGIEVQHLGCLGIWSGGEVGQVGKEEVLRFALANDHPDAQALLIPDTALHTVAFLSELEAQVGKMVLTANQVTLWEALRLAGRLTPQSGLGRLFTDTDGNSPKH